jgi:hypothetical protein
VKSHHRTEIEWIVTTLSLSLIAQIAISWKLWVPFGREFPMISLWAWLPLDLGPVADLILTSLMLASLAGIIILPFSRWFIGLFLLPATLLVLEDVMRLQPWLFLFGVMFLAVAVYGPGRRDSILAAFMLITSATYFWSGVQKLNHAFAVEILPWLAGGGWGWRMSSDLFRELPSARPLSR